MAAGYPWRSEQRTTNPDVEYWRERALRAEREARHNRDLAEFARDMGIAVLAQQGETDG